MDNSDLTELSDNGELDSTGDWLKDLKTYAFRENADRMATIRTASLRVLLRRLSDAEMKTDRIAKNFSAYRDAEYERHEKLIADVALGSAESIRTKQFQDAANETFDMALSDEKKLERLKALLILLQMNLEAAYQRHNERP